MKQEIMPQFRTNSFVKFHILRYVLNKWNLNKHFQGGEDDTAT